MEKNLREHVILIVIIMIIRTREICECCIDSERNGLLEIRSSFNPNSTSYLSSWNTSNEDCCKWERVHCNPTTGHVTRLVVFGGGKGFPFYGKDFHYRDNWYLNASLFLPFRQLNRLSLYSNNIAGCIHNEGFERLSTLANLESLNLDSNKFNKSILRSLSALPFLKSLNMARNKLNGTIKISELNNLASTLQQLDFSMNRIEGFETVQGFERLSTLTNLEDLDLSINYFNNTVLQYLSGLPSLKSLDLRYNKLSGTINSSELNNLSNTLQKLNFRSNGIEGFEIIQDMDGLSNLQELDLSENRITNFIISQGGEGLNKLEIVDLSYNQFNHTTTNFLQSIGRLSSLKRLYLRKCGLSGKMPASQGVCNLKNLYILNLEYNDLNGNLPRCLANMTLLRSLDLSYNQFSGKILSSPLQGLTSLRFLDLSHNHFQVPISLTPFFNHSQLETFHADENALYADIEDHHLNTKFQLKVLSLLGYGEGGALPKFLYHQRDLLEVYISGIKLRGMFPHWLLQNNTKLNALDLSNNSLSGNFELPYKPRESLTHLDISDNFLNGSIPPQIGFFFPNLFLLFVSRNELKGSIPHSLCNMTALVLLDTSRNNLSGTIPNCIGNLSELRVLDLSNNNVCGSIPANFSSISLAIVNLSKNMLQGALRNAFYYSSNLFQLDLSHNNLSGIIPSWIGELSGLNFLVLGYNNLHGEIPIALCNLKRLSFIDLSHNNIVGHILHCLNFTSYWSRKQRIVDDIKNIEITMKGRTYTYEDKVLRYVSGIDLSCNDLNGHIPIEIGDLKSIKGLNFSYNKLTGTIPLSFSNLKEIESLDLSHNYLQGTIPSQLAQLTSLTLFNVSYNNLSGKAPNQVAQFATFDNSSYKGNPFLCGWPLSKSCSKSNSPPSNSTTSPYDDERSNGFMDMEVFYVSFGVAYAMVLLTLVIVLCINPYWRRVWFYYVQLNIDKTYYFIIDNVITLF